MFDNLPELIKTVSYLGIFGIVFAETGLLIGFFLPGDSLLITAGVLAAAGTLDLGRVILACVAGSILGDQMGYLIGRQAGPRIFNRPDSRWLKPEHVERARAFFERYGARTVLLARFVPIVRAFSATTAGVSRMPYPTFLAYSAAGGVLWGAGVPLAGFYLGRLIPDLDRYILYIIALVLLVSVIPVAREVLAQRARAKVPKPE